MCLRIVDDGRTDAGPWAYYELKSYHIFLINSLHFFVNYVLHPCWLSTYHAHITLVTASRDKSVRNISGIRSEQLYKKNNNKRFKQQRYNLYCSMSLTPPVDPCLFH